MAFPTFRKNNRMRTVLFALTFLVITTGQLPAQNLSVEQTGVTVRGMGIVKVTPDRVKIRVRVENEGQSAKEVKAVTDEAVNDVLHFLKEQELTKNDYQTDYINLNKKTNYKTNRTYYSAEQAISIMLKDINRYEELMSGLMESGINRIDGVSFQSSKLEKHQIEARKKAVLNAKEKAENYANTLNLKVGRAEMIGEMGSSSPQPMMQMSAADASYNSSENQTLAPGQMEIKAQVVVRFALELH